MSRRRYVDLAEGQEAVGRGLGGGSGSLRKPGDWVNCGADCAADGPISGFGVDPIRPTIEAGRREATSTTGIVLPGKVWRSAGRGCSPAMPGCSDEISWPFGREIEGRAPRRVEV